MSLRLLACTFSRLGLGFGLHLYCGEHEDEQREAHGETLSLFHSFEKSVLTDDVSCGIFCRTVYPCSPLSLQIPCKNRVSQFRGLLSYRLFSSKLEGSSSFRCNSGCLPVCKSQNVLTGLACFSFVIHSMLELYVYVESVTSVFELVRRLSSLQ